MSSTFLERVPALALTASLVACSASAPERESMTDLAYAELAYSDGNYILTMGSSDAPVGTD